MAVLIAKIFMNSWHYLQEAAPWLLFGFLFAGILKAFVSSNLLFRCLGKGKIRPILIATLIGLPLPLCSCGVIPAGLGLYKQGASRAAALAFLIATPSTTVSAVVLCWGMLGWKFTIAIVIACYIVAMVTGIMALLLFKGDEATPSDASLSHSKAMKLTNFERIKKTFHYGFIEMIDDIGLYIILGILVAGLIGAVVPENIIGKYFDKGLFSMMLMVLIATPMYVCSTASVPLVAAMVAKGMHPAVGLVFLIAGPATNVSTILAITKSMGKKTVILYLVSIIGFSILIAYVFHTIGWLL